ncbi:Putative secretion activating protein [Brucella ceti TE28753-12]|nr:Putative secretion activating protein [Brucella ceti TE28753-12]
MKRNFQTVMPYIFSEEGGYADNPADPGGATNMGITINTLSAWEGRQVSPQDVKELTQATATQIYQVEFWNKIDGNDLPSGVDYALFDFAVNSGPGRAAKTLQKILAMPEDGIIGAQTVAAAAARSPEGSSTHYAMHALPGCADYPLRQPSETAGLPAWNGCAPVRSRLPPRRPPSPNQQIPQATPAPSPAGRYCLYIGAQTPGSIGHDGQRRLRPGGDCNGQWASSICTGNRYGCLRRRGLMVLCAACEK